MSDFGLVVDGETGSRRIQLQCDHHNGVLYVVPSEGSWVCSDGLMHVHAMAGFFRELTQLRDSRVTEIMQRWGLYYRDRRLEIDVVEED